MKRLNNSIGFAALLNLLWPGLGHVYRGELLFGLFGDSFRLQADVRLAIPMHAVPLN
jgi:hypothetical protein